MHPFVMLFDSSPASATSLRGLSMTSSDRVVVRQKNLLFLKCADFALRLFLALTVMLYRTSQVETIFGRIRAIPCAWRWIGTPKLKRRFFLTSRSFTYVRKDAPSKVHVVDFGFGRPSTEEVSFLTDGLPLGAA